MILTYFSPMFHFYTLGKRLETKGFLMFSGNVEMGHWARLVKLLIYFSNKRFVSRVSSKVST